MRRSFKRAPYGRRGGRPSRVWAGVSGQWLHSNISATAAVKLIELQAPASLASLTADPPEDLTVLRIVGSFTCSLLTNVAVGNWTLALLVQDTEWTPGATFLVDADKRILWSRTFDAPQQVSYTWSPPGLVSVDLAGTTRNAMDLEASRVDISPKVKVEAGKALYLVAYENSGSATLTTSSADMRVLFQRSGRPS